MLQDLVPIVVPIFVCVVLPVAIVAIVFWAQVRNRRQKSQVIMEALKHSDSVDINRLAKLLGDNGNITTPRRRLNKRLIEAGICIFTGIALVLIPLLTRNPKSPMSAISEQLTGGSIVFGIGVALLISFIFGYRNLAAEEREYNEIKKDLEN